MNKIKGIWIVDLREIERERRQRAGWLCEKETVGVLR